MYTNVMVEPIEALPAVVHNFENIKQELAILNEKYSAMVYTDATISVAKKDRAMLKKVADEMESKRKAVKTAYLEPYNTFEKEVKEVIALLSPAISNIDLQIKESERLEKEEKRKQVEAIFAEEIGEHEGFVTLDKLWQEKWLNKGESLNSIRADIATAVLRIKQDLFTIESMTGGDQMKAMYYRNLDLSMAIRENQRLEADKQRLISSKQQFTQEVARESEVPPEVAAVVTVKRVMSEPMREEYNYSVMATADEIAQIESFITSMGVKFWTKNIDF